MKTHANYSVKRNDNDFSNADGDYSNASGPEMPLWKVILPFVGLGVGLVGTWYLEKKSEAVRKYGWKAYLGIGMATSIAFAVPYYIEEFGGGKSKMAKAPAAPATPAAAPATATS